MPLIPLGIILLISAYVLKKTAEPNIVMLPPVGPVIFNPAPPTGSNTFLGSITGIPGMYWNITAQGTDIPSGFVNPNATQSSIPLVSTPSTIQFGGQTIPTNELYFPPTWYSSPNTYLNS